MYIPLPLFGVTCRKNIWVRQIFSAPDFQSALTLKRCVLPAGEDLQPRKERKERARPLNMASPKFHKRQRKCLEALRCFPLVKIKAHL